MTDSEDCPTIASISGHGKKTVTADSDQEDSEQNDMIVESETISDNSIYPILIFKPRSAQNCDLELFSRCLTDGNYNSNDIERMKLDKNGNGLIFCNNYKTMKLIMSDEKIFSGARKIILNQSPSLILKGLKFEDAKSHLEEFKQFGILDIEQLGKNKNTQMTKAICKDFQSLYDNLKNPIKLLFGRMVFTEPFMSNIIQCNKCKIFGHVESECKNDKICKTCGITHKKEEDYDDYDDCKKQKCCANCKLSHSCYWRGCKIFIEHKTKKIENFIKNLEKKLKISKNVSITETNAIKVNVPNGMYRNFSSLFSSKNQLDDNNKKNKIEENINENYLSIIEKMEKTEKKMDHLSTKIEDFEKMYETKLRTLDLKIVDLEISLRTSIEDLKTDMIYFVTSCLVALKDNNTHLKNNNGSFKTLSLEKLSEISTRDLGIPVNSHIDYSDYKKSKPLSNPANKRNRSSDINKDELNKSKALKSILNDKKKDNNNE